jgi:hypothetical protein
MAYSVYDSANAYLNKIKSALAINAKTLLLFNEDNFRYELRGGATMVRSADAGGAGTYNKNAGFAQNYGGGNGLTWESYTPQNDRAKLIRVDKADELASYLSGMDSSIGAMASNYGSNYFAPEYDAVNIATLFSKIPAANVFAPTAAGYKLDIDNICQTLINLDMAMFNAGSDGPAVIFMSTTDYATLQAAMLKTPGALAFVNAIREVRVETGFEDILGMDAPLTVSTKVIKWNQHYICPMPTNRMNSVITMLDGQSAGQEAGGYTIGGAGSGNRVVRILAVPLESAFTSVRYEVTNLLIPGDMRGFSISESEVTKGMQALRSGNGNSGMFSNMTVQNVAFNPNFDAFDFQSRIIYGADVFKSRKQTCFAIADTAI